MSGQEAEQKKKPFAGWDDEQFWRWFGGFFDGEGSFVISLFKDNRPRKTRFGLSIKPSIYLTQRDDARFILESIKERTGFGSVQYYKYQRGIEATWQVSGISNCLELSRMLLPFLVERRESCQLFIKALNMMLEKKHYDKAGIIEIARIRDRIGRRRKPKNYWSADKIASYLETINVNPHHRWWSPAEKQLLKEMYEKGVPAKEIAKKLKRNSASVIHTMAYKLKLKHRRCKQYPNKRLKRKKRRSSQGSS